MHWVIQKKLFKANNYKLLVDALETLGIKYYSVAIPSGTYDLTPSIDLDGKVYVCGAIKLKKIAELRGWQPGSFLTDRFNFDLWLHELGDEMLNSDIVSGQLSAIDVRQFEKFFIRPKEDNKAFDGGVLDQEMLDLWRKDHSKKSMMNIEVIASSVKDIYREYRLFFVDRKYVTGSVYKVNGRPQVHSDIEPDVITYANSIVRKWIPSDSFVIDISLSEKGFKVIEFNNINSSGFYGSDVLKYVDAIDKTYSE